MTGISSISRTDYGIQGQVVQAIFSPLACGARHIDRVIKDRISLLINDEGRESKSLNLSLGERIKHIVVAALEIILVSIGQIIALFDRILGNKGNLSETDPVMEPVREETDGSGAIFPDKNGLGNYTTVLPAGCYSVSQARRYDQRKNPHQMIEDYKAAIPDVSEDFKVTGEPVTTHKFWSSVIWKQMRPPILPDGKTPDYSFVNYSNHLYFHPNTAKLHKDGMSICYIPRPALTPMTKYQSPEIVPTAENPDWVAYSFNYREDDADITVSIPGLNAEKTVVDAYGDWTVRVLWKNEEQPGVDLRATFGTGCPFVYYTSESGKVSIRLQKRTRIWLEKEGVVALSRENVRTNYAIIAPKGSKWSYEISEDTSAQRYVQELHLELPPGHKSFSVATLPDEVNEYIKVKNRAGIESFPANTLLSEIPPFREGTGDEVATAPIYQDFFGSYGGYLESKGGYDKRLLEQRPDDFALPPALLDIVRQFQESAFAVPVGSRISYKYDPDSNQVSTLYNVQTALVEKEGIGSNESLIALYPHQWKQVNPSLFLPFTYQSTRGLMKMIKGNQFSTTLTFPGVLPTLPNVLDAAGKQSLSTYLDKVKDPASIEAPRGLVEDGVKDTYNNGKELNRLAQLLLIAKQMGREPQAKEYLEEIKVHLTDWFDASASGKKCFYYDRVWKTLIGYPASYASDTELNDHHFHWGYLIFAAAALAMFDKEWAHKYMGMVELLIKDVANPDRNDKRFPYLRHFDAFGGHSSANGHVNFADGTNQESSSEAMNFAYAVTLWGAIMNKPEIRDLGIFLYTNEYHALRQYWLNIDAVTFPKNVWYRTPTKWIVRDFDLPLVAMIWNGKVQRAGWFGAVPNFTVGINTLPVTAGSLYLARIPQKLKEVNDWISKANILYRQAGDIPELLGKVNTWSDIMWELKACYNPDEAAVDFAANSHYPWEHAQVALDPNKPPVMGEAGESKAHTYHWIFNLKQLGTLVTDITANTPFHAVFVKEGKLSYAVYNPENKERTVKFTDGKVVKIGPETQEVFV